MFIQLVTSVKNDDKHKHNNVQRKKTNPRQIKQLQTVDGKASLATKRLKSTSEKIMKSV